MAKIITQEGKLPKRIDNFVIYPLGDDMIIREVSGFTSKGVKTHPKYEKTRRNASEFGRLSSLCKEVRLALKEFLPKSNNLAVVNSFTKKMREVMMHDQTSLHGQRNLADAFKNEVARSVLEGYDFNPDNFNPASKMDFRLRGKDRLELKVHTINLPDGANSIGFRIIVLDFDFETKASQLALGQWHFYNQPALPDVVDLTLPIVENPKGVVFTLLETSFYDEVIGSFRVVEEGVKSVRVVAIDSRQ